MATMHYFLLACFFPAVITDPSSSEPSPAPFDEELFRDAPLYPPLRDDTTHTNEVDTHIENTDTQYNADTNDIEISNDDLEERLDTQDVFEMFDKDFKEYDSENPFSMKDGFIVATGGVEASVDIDTNEESDRVKRSSGWDAQSKSRVKTGDTILNIRGAVRDAIGDAGAAPGPRASSRVDAFVIRPSPVMRDEPRDQAREPREKTPPKPEKKEKELLVRAHESATLQCELRNVSNIKWYKDNEQILLPDSPDEESAYRSADSVVIPRATRNHAARWRCTGITKGRVLSGEPVRLRIYEPVRSVYLAVDGRRLDAGNTWVPVRDKTVLEVRCVAEGGVPPPELSWRLLAAEPSLDHRPYLRVHPTNYSMEGTYWSGAVVTAARELHNATLRCDATQRQPNNATQRSTAKLQVHVTYPPSFVISRWPGFGVSLWAGGAAALRCDVDSNPPARPVWTRDNDIPLPQSSPSPTDSGSGSATLRWSRLRGEHAGWYRCRALWQHTHYSSIGYYLNVRAPDESVETSTEVNEEPVHQKVEVPLGGNVQLHCPKGSVGCWWRRVVGNASDTWAPAGSHHAHGVLGISEAMWEEGGEYRCVGARANDRARLKELKRVTLSVTGGAVARAISTESLGTGFRLTCSVCGRGVRAAWVWEGRAQAAALSADLAQHCWRSVLHTRHEGEVWCVAVASAGSAVAVFPKRTSAPSLSPARHAVRALHSNASTMQPTLVFLVTIFVSFNFY